MERRIRHERRRDERRKQLTEEQFRRLIEKGRTVDYDRRSWTKRRGPKRRKRQVGI